MDRHEVEEAAVAAGIAKINTAETAEVAAAGTAEVEAAEVLDPAVIARGLAAVRRRRWYLWIVLIVYLPTMYLTQRITHSFSGSMPVFFCWFAVLLGVMFYSATARCPRCRNYYHMHGMMLLYLRKCLHCQLPLTADKGNDL